MNMNDCDKVIGLCKGPGPKEPKNVPSAIRFRKVAKDTMADKITAKPKLIPGLHLNGTPGTTLYRVEKTPRRTGISQSSILCTYFLLLLYLCTEV